MFYNNTVPESTIDLKKFTLLMGGATVLVLLVLSAKAFLDDYLSGQGVQVRRSILRDLDPEEGTRSAHGHLLEGEGVREKDRQGVAGKGRRGV